jgi:dinuclear metal center YbgI/SA1388 family protein
VPAALHEILDAIDELLEPGRFEDYCVNGLQVPGPERVATIATGVSANAELFSLAAAEGAELLIVHHGLFWGPGVRAIDPLLATRLKLLFDAGIALAAYHLPLDAHPELGNNALLARELGAAGLRPFGEHRGQPIGFLASLPDGGLPPAELCERVGRATGQSPLHLDGGPEQLREVAIVTGAGADYIGDAAAAGAQALITGEAAERATALAREHRVHLIAAGHHATETFGVRALGERLAERFAVRHVFLNVPNPV